MWLKSRTVVITFEECWPLGGQLELTPDIETKVRALCKVTTSIKHKDAAGLGTLGHALSEGDEAVFRNDEADKQLRIVAAAIRRPPDFFQWLSSQCKDVEQQQLAERARRYLSSATWPWDKAFILAGAYLGVTGGVPTTTQVEPATEEFPYWVALDKHTPQGKEVLRQVAKEMRLQYRRLLWASFYLESARSNAHVPSMWWDREVSWRFERATLSISEARDLWDRARPRVMSMLHDEAARLRRDVEEAKY